MTYSEGNFDMPTHESISPKISALSDTSQKTRRQHELIRLVCEIGSYGTRGTTIDLELELRHYPM